MEILKLRRVKALRQFRALIRLVIANKAWMVEDELIVKGGNIKLAYMGARKQNKSILEVKHKALLNKPAEFRTDEEKNLLYKIIGGTNCFRKYPPNVQLLLAGSAYFAYYGPDRTIVRQNHIAEAMYFILSGEVTVWVRSLDPVLNEYTDNIVDTYTTGNAFGEISLLNDVPRAATLVTKTPVELLVLKREDFNIILKDSVRKEWDTITDALNRFSYFKDWDDVTTTECCLVSRMKQFQKNQTILGDNTGLKTFAHFVLKGNCKLIQDISVQTVKTAKGYSHKFYAGDTEASKSSLQSILKQKYSSMNELYPSKVQDEKSSDHRPPRSSVTLIPKIFKLHFIEVCTFSELAVFGLGENMRRRRIIADNFVECLVIPLYWLTSKGQNTRTWTRIQQYLESHIPSPQQLFDEYVEQRKWREFKRQLVNSKVKKSPTLVPSSIPYSVRIKQDFEYIESL